MKFARTVILLCLVPGWSALAELNLSPQLESFDLEGFKTSQLAFDNGRSQKATYQPPRDWKCTGGSDYLALQPGKLSQTAARVTKLAASESVALDDGGREQLKQKALLSLPEGSQKIEVKSEQIDPLQIDGMHTYLIELKYVYFGETFRCYSLTLDRKPEALNFRLSCREKDYEELRKAFQTSLCTWQNL